jgi:protocatechuate 3,4-dioxygenase beta subunit
VLNQSGIVRRDIRSSFGERSGTAAGVPLTILLTMEDTATGCAPLANAAVYLWHCDRDGNYSLYGVTDQNYLRGVQEADADGIVTFTSIYPACYAGRWPHIHFFGDDGGAQELGRVTGSIDAGLTVELTVPVAVT